MKLMPLADRVVVEKQESEKKTSGGIIIPEQVSEKPSIGKVISIGKDVKELKESDTVYFGKYSGTEVKIEDKTLLILKEEEVLAVLN